MSVSAGKAHPQKPHAGTDIEPRGASSAPLGGSECQRCCVATSLRVQVRCTSHGLSCRGGGTRDAATAERRLYGVPYVTPDVESREPRTRWPVRSAVRRHCTLYALRLDLCTLCGGHKRISQRPRHMVRYGDRASSIDRRPLLRYCCGGPRRCLEQLATAAASRPNR